LDQFNVNNIIIIYVILNNPEKIFRLYVKEYFALNFIVLLLLSLLGLISIFYIAYYSLNLYKSKKDSGFQKKAIFPKVSLIIPTYNEEKTILRKLENLKTLNYPRKMLEILVVDSNSSDNTKEIVSDLIQRYQGILNLKLICQQLRMGKALAINLALQHTTGEICIISDADATFEKNAILKLVENFADPNIGAVTGKLVILNANQSSVTKLEKNYRSIFEILRLGETNMDSTPVFNGPIMAFRRNLVQELDSETIADDTELSLKIRKQGLKAIYTPDAIAYEYTPTTVNSRTKQKIRRGQGIIQSFVRNKDVLFNSKYGIYGFIIFPSEFFMHIISPILLLIILSLTLATVSIDLNIIIYFGLAATSLLLLSGLLLAVKKFLLKSKNAIINPVSFLSTFLTHQFCLLIGLSLFLLGKSNSKWEKIENVGIQCNIEDSKDLKKK